MIDEPVTREMVVRRLEEAGATLIEMRMGRIYPSEQVTGKWPEMVRDSFIDVADATIRVRRVPSAGEITQMDEVWGWIREVPRREYKRALCARSLVDRETGRHWRSWLAIARTMCRDRETVMGYFDKGVAAIVSALGGRPVTPIVRPSTIRQRRRRIRAIYAA